MSAAVDIAREREVAFESFDREAGEAVGLRNASDARLVEVVGRCLTERWWEHNGTRSPEHWCKVRLGVGAPTAAKLLRCAAGLDEFPHVAAAFARGQLSLDHVDVIVTNANPVYDKDLSTSGPTWDVPRMRRIIVHLPIPKQPEPEPDVARPESATPEAPADRWHAGWHDDGRYRGSFDLGAPLGGLLESALRLARSSLFTARTGLDPDDDDREREPTIVTGVDTVGRLLHAAIDGLDPNTAAGRRPGDRTQVLVHVDAEHPERARLHLGPLLSATDTRELLCDADLRVATRRDGRVVALGRRRRTVNHALRVLVEDRDQGCRVDGCGRRGFLHVHHLVHWADGGPTDPSNLASLCPEHHRMVHAGQLRLVGDPERPDGLVTIDARGRPLPRPEPIPPPELPAAPSWYRGTYWGQRINVV